MQVLLTTSLSQTVLSKVDKAAVIFSFSSGTTMLALALHPFINTSKLYTHPPVAMLMDCVFCGGPNNYIIQIPIVAGTSTDGWYKC